MNIKVDRNLFLGELYYLQGVAGTKQIIPILSHLLIETGTGKITMRATDLDLTITTECEAGVREKGSICLPARKLMEIVKSLPQAEIEIKASDLCQATINCAPSRFKLNGLAADNFPESQEYSGVFGEVPAEIFSRFIPRVIHAAGQEGSRYALNGAKLEISNERFTVGRGMITPAIKRVSLMAEDRSRAIKMEIGGGEMRISSECSGIGEAGETIPITYDGDRITAGFNAAYLNDFFHAIEEEEVLFEFKDGSRQRRKRR